MVKLASAAYPDGDPLRDRLDPHVVKMKETPVVSNFLTGKQSLDYIENLIRPSSSVFTSRTRGLEFRTKPPSTYCQDESPFRQHLQGGDLLGQHDRLTEGKQNDPRAQERAACQTGCECQRDQGLQPRAGIHVARPQQVVNDPDRIEAQFFTPYDPVSQALNVVNTVGIEGEVRKVQANLHLRTFLSGTTCNGEAAVPTHSVTPIIGPQGIDAGGPASLMGLPKATTDKFRIQIHRDGLYLAILRPNTNGRAFPGHRHVALKPCDLALSFKPNVTPPLCSLIGR